MADLLTCEKPSRSRYSHGCRCFACSEAQNNYQRRYYERVGGNRNRKPHHKRSASPWTDSRKAAYQVRRAIKSGVEAESFKPLEIFERDGWVCGICSLPVLRELSYPDPRSVSLDHIQPLSRDGAHVRSNTRCAHLFCNVARGNRI